MEPVRPATPLFAVVAHASRPLLRGVFRLRAHGFEHLPAGGGFVLAANHLSMFDPWPLAFPLFPRHVHYMAKGELYEIPPLRLFLDQTGAFPVRRGSHHGATFRTAVSLAHAGGVVAIFPEGARRKKGGRKEVAPEPRAGAARIALTAGVPLVPAAIVGTERLRRLGPLRVAYGAPIRLDGDGGVRRRDAAREATERLMGEVARLERELAES